VSDADALGTSATDTGPCTLDTLTIRLIGTGCVPASDPAWCDVSVGVSCNGLDAPAPPDCRYAAANMGAGQVFYCCPRCALPP
jgi:hypothetical protein